jgi:hypothetical protein
MFLQDKRFSVAVLDKVKILFLHDIGKLILWDYLFIKYSIPGIYGPYVKLAQDRHIQFPDWYKGPARLQDKSPPSILESLFSQSNRYKGKFLPIPSNLNTKTQNQIKSSPGPTTYFKDSIPQQKFSLLNHEKNPLFGFLSSTERVQKTKISISHLGPASYKSNYCPQLCSKKKQKNHPNI